MKVKKIILTVALVSMAIFLVACAKSGAPAASTDGSTTSADGTTATADNSAKSGDTSGNNTRTPRRRPDLYGQVLKIIGNEVTLKVAEMPKRTARQAGNSGAGGQQGQQGSGQQTDALAGAGATLGGSGGQGSGQGGPGGGGQGGPGGWQGQRSTTPIKYTGQVDKIIIPVGVPITSMKRSTTGGAPTQAQLNISEITEGTMLQIYYAKAAAGEAKTVESVRVIPARQN